MADEAKTVLENEKHVEESTKRIKNRVKDFTAAYRAGDAKALWNAFFPEGSYLMPPGHTGAQGEEGIKYFADLMSSGTKKMKWEVEEINIRGDWATEKGTYSFHKGDMEATLKGETYDTWQRNEKDGEWYIYSGLWQEKFDPQ